MGFIPRQSRPAGSLGFVDRVTIGAKLALDSLAVIKTHPSLVAFPILGALAAVGFVIILFLPLAGPVLVAGRFEFTIVVLLGLVILLTTFAGSFFTAALVHAANEIFHGRQPTIAGGIRGAAAHWRMLLVWSVISAAVGIILNGLERRGGLGLAIVRAVFGLTWAVVTFFIIPVIVLEDDHSVREVFTRSGRTFADTWGETLTGGLGLGLITVLAGLLAVAFAAGIGLLLAVLVPGLGILALLALVASAVIVVYFAGETAIGVAKTALYLYAEEGLEPTAFTNFEFRTLDGAITPDANQPDQSQPA